MHTFSRPFRRTPPLVEGTLAALAGFVDALVWAQQMRRECESLQRSGRVLDGAALRLIARRLEHERGLGRPGTAAREQEQRS